MKIEVTPNGVVKIDTGDNIAAPLVVCAIVETDDSVYLSMTAGELVEALLHGPVFAFREGGNYELLNRATGEDGFAFYSGNYLGGLFKADSADDHPVLQMVYR